jgi:GAF domain-containing protein
VGETGLKSVERRDYDVLRMLDQSDDLTVFLDSLVRWAVKTTPGAEACGLTVERAGRGHTVAHSGELALRGDERQYDRDDGPCLQAMRSGELVVVADMADEQRWGTYPQSALAEGIRATLSLPLRVGDADRGALNLYSKEANAFTHTDLEAARSWAGQAGGALSVALRMAERDKAVENLRRGMASRQVIGQAVGMLMVQRRCTAQQAFDILAGASQRTNGKLRDLAARMVKGHEDQVRSAGAASPGS